MSDCSRKSSIHKSSVQGSLRINEGENLCEEIKNTKNIFFYLKDILSRYLSVHEKHRNRDKKGSNKKIDNPIEPHSQSEAVYNSHHNMDYYQKHPRQHRRRSHHNYSKETKVDLPPSHGRKMLKNTFRLEMKVEQLLEKMLKNIYH